MNCRAATNAEDLPYLLIVGSLTAPVFGVLFGATGAAVHLSFLAMLAIQAPALMLRFLGRRRRTADQDTPALTTSIAYYRFVVRQHDRAGLALTVGTAGMYVTMALTRQGEWSELVWLAILPLVFFALATARVWILRWRVLTGRFAREQPETQELIDFIVLHGGEIGNGGHGSPRRVLMPMQHSRTDLPSVTAAGDEARV